MRKTAQIEKAKKAFKSQMSYRASEKAPFIAGYLAAIKDMQKNATMKNG